MKQAFIYVPEHIDFSGDDLSNAVNLCRSITESPILLWRLIEQSDHELRKLFDQLTLVDLKENTYDNFGLLRVLDSYSLQEEIFIVSIGSTEKINAYLHNRLRGEQLLNVKWNIVSSDYARYSLLEKQRSLSDYIPVDTQIWLREMVKKFGVNQILDCLDKIDKSRTVVVGESIIDEYIYCEALGKVSKDPIVAFQRKEKVRQAGGVLAAAKHFVGLGSQTTIISELGAGDTEFFVRDLELSGVVNYDLSTRFTSIVKTRYVDRASGARVFETYDLPVNYDNRSFHMKLEGFLETHNQIGTNFVIMDYGHQLLSDESVELLLNSNIKLSVNTQSNAGNRGFNSIARYKGAQKAFLNGSEVQLEARNKHSELSVVVYDLGKKLDFEEIYVTNGSRGIIACCFEKGQYLVPAFAPTIIDRVGAGDATLAVISALRAVDIPIEIACFYGNIAGALLVSTMGNEVTISKQLLRQEAASILRKVS